MIRIKTRILDGMSTIAKRVTAKEARDNFTDILGMVYYGKEPVVVEKKGRVFAVVINPDEYESYKVYKKAAAKKRFFEIVDDVQAKSKGVNPERVLEDVTKAVEKVRQELYEKRR